MGRKKKSEEDESEFITIADARASMRRGGNTQKKSLRIFSDATLDKLSDAQRDRSTRTRLDRERKFLTQSRAVHGDRYDYSKVEYVNSKTMVTIICPDHGEYETTPNQHNNGRGCPDCSRLQKSRKLKEAWVGRRERSKKQREEKKKTVIKTVINDFRKVHGDRYDYSQVEYVGAKRKVVIVCPDHGEFEKTPDNHKSGQGCPTCGRIERSQRKIEGKKKTVITDFRKVHGDRYDYSKVEYVKSLQKVTIICPDHGEFEQTPNSHLSGSGCPQCGKEKALQNSLKTRRGRRKT